MQFHVTSSPEREIKFLVTGDIPEGATILRTSLIRQTHLGSKKSLEELFAGVKLRIISRINYLMENGILVPESREIIDAIESALH